MTDKQDLPLRSEAAQTFMRLVVENLKSEGVASVMQAMAEAADAAYEKAETKQSGGTLKKSYYRFIAPLANEALRQGMAMVPGGTSVRRRVINESDPAREEQPKPPLPDDPFEALLQNEIGARVPSPVPSGEVRFEAGELDDIERQLEMEMAVKKARAEFAAFAENAAEMKLAALKAITKPGDFFRRVPTVHKLPDPPNCGSSISKDNAVIVLPSATFVYQGKVVTRNCAVNNRTVKVGHPLAFKMPDGSHLIRSHKEVPGKDERWVKVVRYTEGALIRYFTHIDNEDAQNMRWYGVVRRGEVVPISEAEYRGLEVTLPRD